MCKLREIMFCKAIKAMLFKWNEFEFSQMIKYCQSPENEQYSYDIRGMIGMIYAYNGNIISANSCLASSAMAYISLKCENGVKYCVKPLCLGQWLFWYLYARFMHSFIKNYRKAKYLYILAIKQNKYDASSYFWYSVLMKDCGKNELALKYWKKSQKLNNKIKYLFTDMEFINKYEFEMRSIRIMCNEECYYNKNLKSNECKYIFNECNWCNAKSNTFKKCSQCKTVLYCSIK
eukprot:90725_1